MESSAKQRKAELQLPFYWCAQSREVMGGGLETGQQLFVFPTQVNKRSLHPTPPFPGFPVAFVQPRVWNSIQEQAWQTLFFISMETRACNKTRTPCLKCQNSLTHFSLFLQKQNEFVWVLWELTEKWKLLLSLWTFWRGTNSDNLWKLSWCYRTTVRSQTWIALIKGLISYTKSILHPCPNLLEGKVRVPLEIHLLTKDPILGMQTWGNCFLNFILYCFLPHSILASLGHFVP